MGFTPVIRHIVFGIGCLWAVFVWRSYVSTSHCGYNGDALAALACATEIAPAYLLVAIRRSRGYRMRAFVATAFALLVLKAFRWFPRWIDFRTVYLVAPIGAALIMELGIRVVHLSRRSVGDHLRCPVCSYDLHGNVSGICPECGTPICTSD